MTKEALRTFTKTSECRFLCLFDFPRSQVEFPLTLTLSLGEREQPASSHGDSTSVGFADRLATFLPLPEGEGRGEGKGAVLTSNPLSDQAEIQILLARAWSLNF